MLEVAAASIVHGLIFNLGFLSFLSLSLESRFCIPVAIFVDRIPSHRPVDRTS